MTPEPHLRDVAELVAANTKLSEVLAESQREVVAKIGTLSADQTTKLIDSCHRQRVMNWVLLSVIVVGAWFSHQQVMISVENANTAVREAIEAKVATQLAEKKLDDFKSQQIKFNKEILTALENQ